MNPRENSRYHVPVRVNEGAGAVRAARKRDNLAEYFSSPEGLLHYL